MVLLPTPAIGVADPVAAVRAGVRSANVGNVPAVVTTPAALRTGGLKSVMSSVRNAPALPTMYTRFGLPGSLTRSARPPMRADSPPLPPIWVKASMLPLARR